MIMAQPFSETSFSGLAVLPCAPNRHLQNACLIGFDGARFLGSANADKAAQLDRDKQEALSHDMRSDTSSPFISLTRTPFPFHRCSGLLWR